LPDIETETDEGRSSSPTTDVEGSGDDPETDKLPWSVGASFRLEWTSVVVHGRVPNDIWFLRDLHLAEKAAESWSHDGGMDVEVGE